MNFLAHAYLSGNNDELLIGNFIADHVKGRMFERYSSEIQKGIILHRRIDSFSDSHPVFRQSVARLRWEFGKYSGVLVDMFYDHFLARNWKDYSEVPLRAFTSAVYNILMRRFMILPAKTKRILPFMLADDWLAGYAYLEGLNLALTGMARRTNFYSGMEYGVESLKQNYNLFEEEFTLFFHDLRNDVYVFGTTVGESDYNIPRLAINCDPG